MLALASELPAARPILKWAGGKTQLLRELTALIPERFGAYHEQLTDFLIQNRPEETLATVGIITDALNILEQHPCIGRPLEAGLRALVISRGRTGYVALYEYDEGFDLAIVLAVRYQREEGFH